MQHRNKIILFLLTVSCLMFVLGWWAFSQYGADDVEYARHEDLKRRLFELGAIRLAIMPEDTMYSHGDLSTRGGQPPQFFFFHHLQGIRRAGYEPVWRNDGYILRDINSKQEVDPFILHPGKGLNSRREIDDDEYLRQLFSMLDLNDLLFYTYYRQLYGFHLVLRPGGFFGDKFLFVKDVQEEDVEVMIEQLMTLDDTISFNCSEVGMLGPESEARLRERGFMMKKRGDGHIPVSLETGEMAELPPKQFFVDDALRNINHAAGVHGVPLPLMGERHIYRPGIGSWEHPINRPYYVEKVLLELYGLEIRWNEMEHRYELVQ